MKFVKLAKIMETKGNKILCNIKTRWIVMISHVKHVLFEYCTFFTKMALNAPTITFSKSNLCLLTNIEILLGLNAITPLLETMQSLIKFTPLYDVFACNFLIVIKICERMYIGCIVPSISFSLRWCLYELPSLDQLCSWEHKIFDRLSI